MNTPESTPRSFLSCCYGSTPRDQSNMRRVLWTYLAWTMSFAAGSQLLKRGIVGDGPLAWALTALPIVVAGFVLAAYARFLREADEMQRMIHLEGMAVGFGGGFLGVSCWRVLEHAGLSSPDIGDATLLLAVSFALGIVRATMRYR